MAISITQLIWLIGIHSIIHGIFGMLHIYSSMYVNYSGDVIHTFGVCNIVLIMLGIGVFFVIVWRRPLCCKIFAAMLVLMSLIYFIMACVYFGTYLPFFANSIFDSFLFYSDIECWCGPDYLFSIWHLLTLLLILLAPLWIVYGFLLCKYAHCVCCLPCPPVSCNKRAVPNPCPPCCRKIRWYEKMFKAGKCAPSTPQGPVYPPPCATQQMPPPPQYPLPACSPYTQPPNVCSPPICPQASSMCPLSYMQNQPPPPPPPQPAPNGQNSNSQPNTTCTRKTPKFVLTLKPGRLCGPK